MTRRARKSDGALDRAKRLQGVVERLGERRQRQIKRADIAFGLDLKAALTGQPDWLVMMVHRAIEQDPDLSSLAVALTEALAELGYVLPAPSSVREFDPLPWRPMAPLPGGPPSDAAPTHDVRAAPAPTHRMTGADRDAAAERMWNLMPEVGDAQPVVDRTAPTVHEGLRYPEPGEPARMLDDGTVVAVDADELATA